MSKSHLPVGRVNPQGVTRQAMDADVDVGLRCANPTYGANSDLPWKVDIVDWATTSASFRKVIERDKVVIQELERDKVTEELVPLISLVSIRGGKRLPAGKSLQQIPNSHPYIRVRDLGKRDLPETGLEYVPDELFPAISRYIVETNDVLLSIVGTIGALSIVGQRYHLASLTENCVKLTGLDRTDALYLYYYLSSPIGQHEISKGTVGAVQPKLPIYNIEKLPVPWGDKSWRRLVSETLGSLDDKIALLHETNATLEAIAQALFKSWFVDFDPVRAKTGGLEPEGIPPEIAALFPGEFEDSELGEIPKGWRAMPLADACEINPTRRLTKGKQAPYLEMSALPTQGHRPETPISRVFSSGTKFINGDTLLARITPCLENGKTAFVDCLPEGEVGWGSTEYIVLRPKAPLPNYWAYLLSRHEHFRQFAIQAMVGTSGRQRVEVTRLAQYLVTVPDERVSVVFAEIVEPLQRRIAANDDSAKTLTSLRDTLLPRLMTGKLRISELQEAIEEAAV